MKKAFTTEPHFYCKKRKQTLAIKTRRMYIRRSQGGSAKPDLLLRSYMVGRVLLRPEPVDKPEHLHLSISRKLSNQWGTPHVVFLNHGSKKLFFLSLSLDKTITKAYFMVTKNRILRFLTVNNRSFSQKRIDRGSL